MLASASASSLRALRGVPALRAAPACTALGLRSFTASHARREHFLNANAETFAKVTSPEHSKDKIVLVDFYADWCRPCKMLSPILEKLTNDASVKSGSGRPLDLVTIDTDTETELSREFGIRSLPTVIAFKDGKPVSQFLGAMPEESVRKFISTV